jgi:hypothetical protein
MLWRAPRPGAGRPPDAGVVRVRPLWERGKWRGAPPGVGRAGRDMGRGQRGQATGGPGGRAGAAGPPWGCGALRAIGRPGASKRPVAVLPSRRVRVPPGAPRRVMHARLGASGRCAATIQGGAAPGRAARGGARSPWAARDKQACGAAKAGDARGCRQSRSTGWRGRARRRASAGWGIRQWRRGGGGRSWGAVPAPPGCWGFRGLPAVGSPGGLKRRAARSKLAAAGGSRVGECRRRRRAAPPPGAWCRPARVRGRSESAGAGCVPVDSSLAPRGRPGLAQRPQSSSAEKGAGAAAPPTGGGRVVR